MAPMTAGNFTTISVAVLSSQEGRRTGWPQPQPQPHEWCPESSACWRHPWRSRISALLPSLLSILASLPRALPWSQGGTLSPYSQLTDHPVVARENLWRGRCRVGWLRYSRFLDSDGLEGGFLGQLSSCEGP